MTETSDPVDRKRWMRFVRSRLIPLRFIIPVGLEEQEWSREYRDLVFGIAQFEKAHREDHLPDLAAKFLRETSLKGAKIFNCEEIALLLAKVREYNLTLSGARTESLPLA